MNNKRVLITGGTGSFGNEFVKIASETYPDCELIVFSRDDMKQEAMREKFPHVKYFLGDVRDLDRLKLAFNKVDIVVHAAALKIVPSGESEPMEYVKTNINGAMNVIQAAIEKDVGTVVALSTDKAVAPANLYGATKLCSDKLFLAANNYNRDLRPVFSIVRYGNVMGSRGSVIPLFVKRAKNNQCLHITDKRMTRFMMHLKDAVQMVMVAINENEPKIHIPKIPSMNITTIAEAVQEFTNKPDLCIKEVGIREGEKIHESLSDDYHSNTNTEWMEKEDLIEWMSLNYDR